ncbi:MAG: AI-2E family transporter [Gemmatimonadales bacterium]
MAFLDTSHQRASFLILLLGLGLLVALAPYVSGLVGGLVLYVIFAPVHGALTRRIPARLAAGLVVLLALVVLVVPTVSFAGLVANQAQSIASGVIRGPLLDRIAQLRFGEFELGPQVAGLGERVVTWIGASAFGLLGTATRIGLNLTLALFITYYLLLAGGGNAWRAVKPYIPFSSASADILRDRFRDVTISTVIGSGLIAAIQGGLVAVGFWATGLGNALFWGLVTTVFAILPVVGAGLVWGPGAITLLLAERYGAAVALILIGTVVVGNIDLLVRPLIFRRYAQIHPLVTLVGAIGGVGYFGLIGILIGPLAVSYFFELIRMYRDEYLPGGVEPEVPPALPAEPAP